MRRSLTITAVALLLVGIGVVMYFYFFHKAPTPPPTGELPVAGQAASDSGKTTGQVIAPNTPAAVSPRLVRISAGPVAFGEVVVNKNVSASSTLETVVSYVDRTSGNIFTYSSVSKTTTRTSNKTLPGIQSVSWLPDASLAFVRYLSGADFSTINTYGLPSSGSGGFFLSQNLADITVSSSNLLTVASGVNGSTASLVRTDGSHSAQVFTTPLSSIRASFAGKNQYVVYTKPSSTLMGDVFLVTSGSFSRIFGPRAGVSALSSPSGKWVLTTYLSGGAMRTALVDTATNTVIPLPLSTMTEKCVWAEDDSVIYCSVPIEFPSASYPDDWYQGAIHFSDRIWRIQVSGRYAQLVLDFNKEAGSELDAVALAVDPSNSTLVFVNKNDLSLWSYSL